MTWLTLGKRHSNAISELVKSRSERVVAIVGGALFDSSLRSALEL